MNQFLLGVPKFVIAIGAILIGFIFIILNDPPKTICDSQIELFKEAQKHFLYSHTEKGISIPAPIKARYEDCQKQPDPGGCFEYFLGLKKLVIDLRQIPAQCNETAAGTPEIRKWLWASLELMAQIAWGGKPPVSYLQRHAWYDASDVSTYCDLKEQVTKIFGKIAFEQWREKLLKTLPNAAGLSREQLWPLTIFSTKCESYK